MRVFGMRRWCKFSSCRSALTLLNNSVHYIPLLSPAGIVTVVRRIGKVKKCTVAVDGSLYKYHPRFKFVMDAAMEEIEPGNGIKMKESTDGSGRGAAIIAAVANRLTKK